jgi:hypothetical protein
VSSAALEVQTAIFAILDADATLSALVTGVFDDVPESYTDFPYVTLGEDVLTEFDTDGLLGFRVSVTIHCWSQYKGQRETKLIQDAIYRALHHIDVTVSGYNMVLSRQVDQTSERDPDGMTRHGVQTFEILIREGGPLPASSILSPLNVDLLAMYTMDDISGATLADESLVGRDGTITGATAVAGHLNNALSFNGSSDSVDLGAGALIPTTGDFSVTLWLKPSDLTGTHTLFSQWQDSQTTTRFRIATNGLALDIRYGSGITTTGEVLTNSVYQMVTVQVESGFVEMFVNAASVLAPAAVSGTLTSAGALLGANSTSGSVYNANVGTFFAGDMDQVRIFNRALTQSEIDELYNSGVGA